MKGYNVCNKQLEIEIVSACIDEYEMQLSNGIEPEEAYKASINDVADILKEKSKPRNKYFYSLVVCCCAFIVSIIEIIIPKLSSQPLEIYGFEMPVVLLIFVVALVYMIVKRRKFHWYDFVIIAIFIVSWAISLIQVGVYAYHATMPDRYWSAEYGFPCIIKILTYITETFPEVNYELASVRNTYSFNLIFSIISLIIILALIINKKIKEKGVK